jgi:hypothetical protein
VKHTSKFINPIFRRLLPLLEPTRNDKTLPKFSNYADLWAHRTCQPSRTDRLEINVRYRRRPTKG